MTAGANHGKLGYGLAQSVTGGRLYYQAVVPLCRGRMIRTFKSLTMARMWQLVNAYKYWGVTRWAIIKRGRVGILRKFGAGVSVCKYVTDTGNILYVVKWYDHNMAPKSRTYSTYKYHGQAEIMAHWYAAQQRARLTGSELNLPYNLTPFSFDLENAVRINKKND